MPRPSPLSSRDRRTLLVGGVVVSVLVLGGRAVPAWLAWVTDARASATELRAEQANARAVLRAYPAVRDSARQRAARARVALTGALHTDAPGAAGALLTERVTTAAAGANVRLGPLTIDAPDARADTPACAAFATTRTSVPARVPTAATPCVRRVRLRTEITGDLRGITLLLVALERGAVHVAVPQFALAQPDPAAPPTREEVLRGTITLEALATSAARTSP